MQYSVSPRRTLMSFGPNPSENVRTRTPYQRATRKCPSSCTKIRTPRTNRNASGVWSRARISDIQLYDRSVPIVSAENLRAHASIARTSAMDVTESGAPPFIPAASSAASMTPGMPVKPRRPARNASTATSFAALSTIGHAPPCGERLDRPGAGRETARDRAARTRAGGEPREIERRPAAVPPIRIGERVLNRQPHVGDAQLRDHRSVDELDHRVDDRLRMDDDVDLTRGRRRTASAPRSPRGPCSSASPSRW